MNQMKPVRQLRVRLEDWTSQHTHSPFLVLRQEKNIKISFLNKNTTQKFLLFLVSILFQSSVYSEIYSCIYPETETHSQEQIVYKRNNDKFTSIESGVNNLGGDTFFEIYNENKEFLSITLDREIYPNLVDIFHVVVFGKKDGTVRLTSIGLQSKSYDNRIGKCILID